MNKVSKIALAVALALSVVGCTKVPAGNVGVKFYLLGGAKGVDTEELKPGRYWIGVNQELYLFPTFTQNYTWTKEPIDGDNTDESISFQTEQGLTVNADVGISYSVDPAKVTSLFQKYRKGIDEITDVYLRNMVRDALVTAASTRPIETVYGAGKAELLVEVENKVREQVGPLGINIERLYWAGDFRLPASVTESINNKIKATQIAQQRENEVAAAKAEADKAIAIAEGEAKAIDLKGDALRRNPEVLRLTEIEAWKFGGSKVPMVLGAGQTFFNLSAVEKK